ncbi:MAG TPA: HAD-IIA family hydrolase [Egibacteraceae bacterium]|nr:HAD-IIA family hydrolase [Actinomycetota bacterium]HWB71252.1 HAD-IIA family hydrolase [Egibacteraceae bacterium]
MAEAVVDRYAGVVLDIDGVLLRGSDPIAGAPDAVAALREHGVELVFVTNNAAATPARMAERLEASGVPAAPDAIVTSALAAAVLIEPSTRCLVIGEDGLRSALDERGCVVVEDPDEAEVVVVGWSRNLVWDDLRRATLAIGAGARFIGTNADVSYPASEGKLPGNGAILAALSAATGREPEIAGKPEAPLYRAAAARLPDGPLLMVGDRLDTDIKGAAALGWDTALMLTGVTDSYESAGGSSEPTYVLERLEELLEPPATADSG